MSELDDLAKVEDTEAEALIAAADADFADLALDAAAELEQDLELEEAIADAAADEAEIEAEVSEGSPVAAEADETEAGEVDPYREFRAELRRQPGKWYVIHSYAGYEKRVKQNIENRKLTIEGGDLIYQIEVPM